MRGAGLIGVEIGLHYLHTGTTQCFHDLDCPVQAYEYFFRPATGAKKSPGVIPRGFDLIAGS